MTRYSFAGVLLATAIAVSPVEAATILYNSKVDFTAALGASVTDDYSNPGYQLIQSDAAMSAVLGETDYVSTGFNNLNIVAGERYCAGCNGSFRLLFSSTSVTSGNGVFGVGLDVLNNSDLVPYTAFVTFGDNSTANYALAPTSSAQPYFFGMISDLQIVSIDFGLPNGGVTQNGSFQVDNLTIGTTDKVGAVPEPSTWAMLVLGFGAVGFGLRRKAKVSTKVSHA